MAIESPGFGDPVDLERWTSPRRIPWVSCPTCPREFASGPGCREPSPPLTPRSSAGCPWTWPASGSGGLELKVSVAGDGIEKDADAAAVVLKLKACRYNLLKFKHEASYVTVSRC